MRSNVRAQLVAHYHSPLSDLLSTTDLLSPLTSAGALEGVDIVSDPERVRVRDVDNRSFFLAVRPRTASKFTSKQRKGLKFDASEEIDCLRWPCCTCCCCYSWVW